MRGSRIFAGLVIIALIAIGLIYLEDHGYFSNPKVAPLGVMKSDDTAPKPEPPEADQTSPPPPPTTNMSAPKAGVAPGSVKPAASQAQNPAATQYPAGTLVQYPAGTQVQYVDAQGNACRPVQVPAKKVATGTERAHLRRAASTSTWRYTPRGGRATIACGMMHVTSTGQRVVNLQAGMVLNVALNTELSTADSAAGQEFSGYLVGPITYCGEVVVPAGASVEGTVMSLRRHTLTQEDDAILQLRLTSLEANGYRIALPAYSYNRRTAGEVPYKTTNYMNDPNWVETRQTSNRDVTLPSQSVVSFWLQGSTPVAF